MAKVAGKYQDQKRDQNANPPIQNAVTTCQRIQSGVVEFARPRARLVLGLVLIDVYVHVDLIFSR